MDRRISARLNAAACNNTALLRPRTCTFLSAPVSYRMREGTDALLESLRADASIVYPSRLLRRFAVLRLRPVGRGAAQRPDETGVFPKKESHLHGTGPACKPLEMIHSMKVEKFLPSGVGQSPREPIFRSPAQRNDSHEGTRVPQAWLAAERRAVPAVVRLRPLLRGPGFL
jgi:hypothetical protein